MSGRTRNLLLVLLAVGALGAAGHVVRAAGQDPATGKGAPPVQEEGAAPASEPTPAPTPAPTPTADAEEQLEEFVPSEKVPADQAVDFPVDI